MTDLQKAQDLLNACAAQRNDALNSAAASMAEIAGLRRRIADLENEIAEKDKQIAAKAPEAAAEE